MSRIFVSLNLKPSVLDRFLDLRRRGFEIAVDEDVALRRGDQVGGQVLAADVVEIAGDAEWREGRGPLRRVGGELQPQRRRTAPTMRTAADTEMRRCHWFSVEAA